MNFPEKYRRQGPEGEGGMFLVPCKHGARSFMLVCIATDGLGWEHVSITLKTLQINDTNVCPTWEMMCTIKDLFWDKDKTVVQYHPPESEYVSCHHYCLHLWRKVGEDFETPPSIMVGIK